MSTQFTNRQWRLPNEENKSKVSNYSMDFERASASYIDLGTIDITGSCTISFWINFNSISHAYQKIFFAGTSASDQFSIGFATTNQGVAVNTIFASGQESASGTKSLSNNSISTNTWYNVVITKTTGVVQNMYLNGVDDTNTPTGFWWGGAPNVTRIGDSGNALDAKLDGVAIFDYVLSSSQVTTLYGSSSTGIGNPQSITPNPVAWYNLGDQDAFNGADYLVPNSSLKDYVFDFIPNDYIDCGNDSSLDITGNITLSGWINRDDNINSGVIISKWASGLDTAYILRIASSGGAASNSQIQMLIRNTSGVLVTATENVGEVSINKWVHVLSTYDGSNIRVYYNGVELGSGTSQTGNIETSTAPFRIGSRGTEYIDGQISNAQIFNSALPATGSNSIETLYNNGSPLTSMSGFTSLQGWWKLDASATYDSSTTTWTIPDDSSNSNDGTSSGMTQANLVQSDLSFTSGYSPYALDFDSASSDYIDCGDSDNFSFGDGTNDSPFSVSAWVYFNSASTSAGIIAKYAATNATKEWMIYTSPQNFRLLLQDGAYNNFATATSTTIQTNQWYNIITTYDGRGDANANQGINIYVNGQLQTLSYTGSSSYVAMNNTNAAVRIGRYGTGNYFDGSISNCSIWNTQLTQAQVTEIYNQGVPSNLNNHSAYSNLVSWWQLGSNSSFNTNWTVLDEKGSNNGTSSNMGEDAIVDGVGSYANGLSSGMGGDEVIGDAPYSTANSLSVNMDVLDRVTDTPS